MSEPFLGEIKLFSFAKAPQGWALCNGAMLNIAQNQALFALISNKFGGDAKTTFALPDLRSRTPLGLAPIAPAAGRSAYPTVGATGGAEGVTLTTASVPPHAHQVAVCNVGGTQPLPSGGLLANPISQTAGSTTDFSIYLPSPAQTDAVALAAGTVASAGGGQPHNNMQPFLVGNFCIAVTNAFFPQRP